MKIAIVTTGDELLQGITLNTNATWLSERCHALGHEVVWHAVVGDDKPDIGEALKLAAEKADCIIVTGGLGPTADDVTVEALQALIPEGGTPLSNKLGTAPGIDIRMGDAQFFLLPGVPKELYPMFEEHIAPWLERERTGGAAEIILRCFGLPEATIDEKLKGVDLQGTRLSFRVAFPEVVLKVLAREETPAKAKASANRAAEAIRAALGDIIYGEGVTSLAAVVADLLCRKKLTLAIAESCTGGMVADLLTHVPGVSACFERGVVAYSNRSKIEMLGVREETIAKHGAVSSECAIEMADGIRKRSGTSLGLAITGIAGPTGGTEEKPIGTAFIALASIKGVSVQHHLFHHDRIAFKQLASWAALDMVRKGVKS